MTVHFSANPSFTVAMALAAGIVAQAIGRHLRIPGIVPLLAAGIMLGPDGLGIVQPAALGDGLHVLVGFAVAVILFEGGLNLDWRRLRQQQVVIRRLVSLGALITAAGGTLAAHLVMGWEWRLAILFGTLVIVTGPTVITPLLRRLKVQRHLEIVLEAEGIFGDAIGVIVAVFALELVLSHSGESIAVGILGFPSRLVVGALLGVAGGLAMVWLLRFRHIVPEGLENVFTLSLALALYQTSNALLPEAGIVAVIISGLVVGNSPMVVGRELKEFKEQLTVLLLGMLFVLLAADVRLAEVRSLGWSGVATVLLLIFIVRPLNIMASTHRASFGWRDKVFLSWIAPRGIVAAAISSLFGAQLGAAGFQGGDQLRALVFLVIAMTVAVQGATAGFVARLLRVRRSRGNGYAILGAQPLARLLGRLLQRGGDPVILIDGNREACLEAEAEGLTAIQGNALDDHVLQAAEVGTRKAVIGALPNEAVNMLFACRAREDHRVPRTYVALPRGHVAVSSRELRQARATLLFGEETDPNLWSRRLRDRSAVTQRWRLDDQGRWEAQIPRGRFSVPPALKDAVLPLLWRRPDGLVPVDDLTAPAGGDAVILLVQRERTDEVEGWLAALGWEAEPAAGAGSSAG